MRRFHYAWAVCLGGALSLFTIIGFGINVFSVYQPYLIELNGLTNAQASWITTVRSLFSLIAMMTVNQLCARIGIRRTMTLGILLLAASCAVFGLSDTFLPYCAAAALGGFSYGYGGMVPLALVIGHWFRDRRSFALGLASAGSGVSTIFAPALITRLIELYGLRTAFLAESAFVLLMAVLVWRLIRSAPEELDMQPYHLGGDDVPPPPPKPAPAGMTRGLWCAVLFAAFLSGGPGGPGFSHLTVLYTSSGYDSMTVAGLLSFLGFMLSVGKIAGGQIYDVLGGRRGNTYMYGVFLLALCLGCLAPLGGMVIPIVAIVLFGLGFPLSAIPFAVWARDLRGSEGYERSVRTLNVAYAWGQLLFGPVPGVLADWFDSYVPAYVMFLAVLLLSMRIVQYAYRRAEAGAEAESAV